MVHTAINQKLLLSINVHIWDCPTDVLSWYFRLQLEVKRVGRVVEHYWLLAWAVVQVSFLSKPPSVNPCFISSEGFEVLIRYQMLVVLAGISHIDRRHTFSLYIISGKVDSIHLLILNIRSIISFKTLTDGIIWLYIFALLNYLLRNLAFSSKILFF